MKKVKALLIFAILIIFSCVLTACGGGDNPEPTPTPTDKIVSVLQAKYKDNTYDFKNQVTIDYDDSFVFSQSDFIFTAIYSDNTTENVTPTSFGVYNVSDVKMTSDYVPGTYNIKFSYSGVEGVLTFIVNQVNISDVTVGGVNTNYEYTGEAITPEVVLTYHNKTLVKDVDYLVGYGENKIDSGSIIISGAGTSYTGVRTINFTIGNLNPTKPTFTNISYDYNGKDRYTDVCKNLSDFTTVGITNINYTITKGTETVYEVTNCGTYHVSVSYVVGEGYNALEDDEFDVTINPISLANATVTGIDEYHYKGSLPTPQDLWGLTVTLNNKDLEYENDFTVELNNGENIDNVNYSHDGIHASIIIIGTGNYTGRKIVDFNILPLSISYASVEWDNTYSVYYDGLEKRPLVTNIYNSITLEPLVENQDYTVAYNNNVEATPDEGNTYGTVVLTGIGNYCETTSTNIIIQKKNIEYSQIELANNSLEYTGNDLINEFVISNLPDGVVATYEFYYWEYDAVTGEGTKHKVTSIVEPGQYYCDCTLSLSHENDEFGYKYDVNYNLMSTDVYFDVNVTKIEATVDTSTDTRIKDSLDGNIHYDYTGSSIVPTIVVYANGNVVDSNEYTVKVKQEQEISIGENAWTTEVVETIAINVGQYILVIESDHYNFSDLVNWSYIYFYIDKITADESQIIWPTVTYDIFTTNYTLNDNGSVPFIANADEYEFTYGTDGGWPCIRLAMTNYEDLIHHYSQIVFEYNNTVFASFSVNGTPLTATEIYNLSLKYGDLVEITMNDGYEVALGQDPASTSISFLAGIGANNAYINSHLINVYQVNTSNPMSYKSYQVSLNAVFDKFEIDGTNVLIQNSFNNFYSDNGGNIEVTLKNGYQAQYSYSTDGGNTETIKDAKTQSLSTTYLDSEVIGYVDIFRNGEDTAFLRVVVLARSSL